MWQSRMLLAALVALVFLASGCATHMPYRTSVLDAQNAPLRCPASQTGVVESECANVTPEIANDRYELHFVEFDDQGWTFNDVSASTNEHPSQQVDKLMARLRQLLSSGEKLKIILFVHGWKHSASSDDDNVKDFRLLLERAASDELYHAGTSDDPQRKVIGIYVGWRGKPWEVGDPLLNLSFWSRKETASRVAAGSVREMFARLRTMRQYYNTMSLRDHPDAMPPVRTLMIGHSFGGLILYTATSGPLIEALTADKDLGGLPPEHPRSTTKNASFDAVNRVADLIVLVNPAFEASRFEALYRVAQGHRPGDIYEPPMFVSITSETDDATRVAFPIGRFVNTIFERPTSSPEQAVAIKNTPGNMDHYLTHLLSKPDDSRASLARCPNWMTIGELKKRKDNELARAVSVNKTDEDSLALESIDAVFEKQKKDEPWSREFCGGAHLVVDTREGNLSNTNTLVWNIRAAKTIIDGHGDVMNPALLDFVRQIFADTDPRRHIQAQAK